MQLAQEAERLGYHSVWTAEAYGTDAVTPLTWLMAHTERLNFGSAILQMPARTPAMTAMTAATLDLMSGGRFLLGLGLSGPQVVEGWHGQPYGKPLRKTREYVDIVRTILRARGPARAPRRATTTSRTAGRTRPGSASRSRSSCTRAAPTSRSTSRRSVRRTSQLCAEIADGWLPIFFSPTRFGETYGAAIDAGFAKAGGGKTLADFDVAPTVTVIVGDDVDTLRGFVKPMAALYIGGMGARGRNFYNDLACRYGFEAAAKEIQDLYLDGQEARGRRGGPRRAGRRDLAHRPEGAHRRPPRARGTRAGSPR